MTIAQKWRSRVGMSPMGTVSVLAIAAVVVLISLPRLRDFARGENVADARDTVRLLARELAQLEIAAGDAPPTIESLSQRAAVAKALSDTDFLANGRVLRRHGYLFAVVRVAATGTPPTVPGEVFAAPPAEATDATGATGQLAIRAWPWRVGRTGSAALLATSFDVVFHHENDESQWNGPVEPLSPVASWTGWDRQP